MQKDQPWSLSGAPSCLDDGLIFGSVFPREAGEMALTAMEAAKSWRLKPGLAAVKGKDLATGELAGAGRR